MPDNLGAFFILHNCENRFVIGFSNFILYTTFSHFFSCRTLQRMWVHVRMEVVFISKPIAFALLYAFQQKRLDYIANKKKITNDRRVSL